jgi:hypothetical protein
MTTTTPALCEMAAKVADFQVKRIEKEYEKIFSIPDISLESWQADSLVSAIQAVLDAAEGSTAEQAVKQAVTQLTHELNFNWVCGWQLTLNAEEQG